MANNRMLFLNHKEGYTDEVPWTSLPHDLLMTKRRSVLFVGEGNFTFTIAFAALREYKKQFMAGLINNSNPWDGIVSTQYKPGHIPSSSDVKGNCITSVIEYYEGSLSTSVDEDVTKRIEMITALPDSHHLWLYGIDACAIPSCLIPPGAVIWFQCPWDSQNGTYELIRAFLLSTAEKLNEDCYVCVGITKQFPYILDYYLQGILGWKLNGSTPVLEEYRFLGADDALIKEILSFGYCHQGRNDIHKRIIEDHVTLIFQKKSRSSSFSPSPRKKHRFN